LPFTDITGFSASNNKLDAALIASKAKVEVFSPIR
jgi:hypothetical protein